MHAQRTMLTGAIQADETAVGDAGPLGVGGRAVSADLVGGGEGRRENRVGGERVGGYKRDTFAWRLHDGSWCFYSVSLGGEGCV